MTRLARTAPRWTLAALVAAALAFGAAQAPAAPSADAANPFCNSGECKRRCQAAGADGGSCVQADCVCFISATE